MIPLIAKMLAKKRLQALAHSLVVLELHPAKGTTGTSESPRKKNNFTPHGKELRPYAVLALFAVVIVALLSMYVALSLALLFLPFVFYCSSVYRAKRQQKAQTQYAIDLPTLFLAMSAHLRIGMTAYNALERACRMLPAESPIREDVAEFIKAVHSGEPATTAIQHFGRSISLADIELFRQAFLLVVEHGGQFTPTLERLATIGRERALLAKALTARTAGMRLTANVLLGMTPLLLLLLSARVEGYWLTLRTHPVASSVGAAGLLCILAGYGILRSMGTLRV